MSVDSEMLTSLSLAELEALAGGSLAPVGQAQLDQLLEKNGDGQLSGDEVREMDRLLELAERLTVVKARARYTLDHLTAKAARS